MAAAFVVSAAALAGCAAWLAAHRDLGAGLLAARAGRPRAAGWLRSPLALAWRLQSGTLLGWAAGFALAGAVLGSVARGIGPMLNTSSQARQLFIRLGGHSGLVDAYIAAVIGMMGVAAAGYAVAAVLRLRARRASAGPSRCWPPRPAGSAGQQAMCSSRL
jgi:ABC-2 type transport system permease protein